MGKMCIPADSQSRIHCQPPGGHNPKSGHEAKTCDFVKQIFITLIAISAAAATELASNFDEVVLT
jgi:hypothetical protein